MKLALLVVASSSLALADPPSATPRVPVSAPTPAPAPAASTLGCTPAPFVDVMLGGTTDGIFHRVAAGYSVGTCDYAVAIGANVNAAASKQNGGTDGIGLDVEPSLRASPTTRVGLFLSVDRNDNGRWLYGAEARLHLSDVFWLEGGASRS